MKWPTDAKGRIDWESTFEDPSGGLISMVSAAQNARTVEKVTTLLVEQLFIRTGDGEERDRYRAALKRIFADEPKAAEAKSDAVDFLRSIKQDRIERAGKKREPEPEPEPEPAAEPEPVADTTDPAYLFKQEFLKQFDARFGVLNDGIKEPTKLPIALPCYVSKGFAERFRDIAERHLLEPMIRRNQPILSRAELKGKDERAEFMAHTFEDRNFRQRQFDIWKEVWSECTEAKPLPKKPKQEKKGVLKKLIDKAEQRPKRRGEMTVEEWQAAVARVKAANKAAEKVWAELCAPAETFVPPTDDDRETLKGLPGRTAAGIQKHVTAIAQIALQGRSTSAFDTYQQGRPVDLALLAAAIRYPETFLGGKGFLRDIMRGYRDGPRRAAFPLVSRYLVDNDVDLFVGGEDDEGAQAPGSIAEMMAKSG